MKPRMSLVDTVVCEEALATEQAVLDELLDTVEYVVKAVVKLMHLA